MADLARIKRNVAKMAAQGAPVEDIDGYIASEGVTVDEVRAFKAGAADPVTAERTKQDEFYSSGIYAGKYNPLGTIARSLDASASAIQRAPLMGWDDEAMAGVTTAGGLLGDYEQARQKFDARKQVQRENNPVASTVGDVAGGLAVGGTLAKGGLTLAGRSLPVVGRTGAAALEGAAYGGVVGAGEANPGERLAGGAIGAAIGGASGAALSSAGDALASRQARKTAQAIAPTADDLANASNALYQQADAAGITVKPQTTNRLVANMRIAAGELNTNLRPRTAGVVQDIASLQDQPLTLKQLDEVRQSIGLAMKNADAQDVRTLQRMKTIVDSFSDNVKPADITGDIKGFDYIKQARDLWAKKSKTELINDMFDLADVDSAKYSQSGMQNAIKLKAKSLYKRIVDGKEKGFTASETELIRKLAKGEMTPKVIEWLGKFAPRGVVSFGAGVGVGGALGGPVGAAIPGMIGMGAAQIADNAAVTGVNALRNAAATGRAPVLNAITNKTVPLIGGTAGALSSQAVRGR